MSQNVQDLLDRAVKSALDEVEKQKEKQVVLDIINIYDGTIQTYDAYLEICKSRVEKSSNYEPLISKDIFIFIKRRKNDSIIETAWKRLNNICRVLSMENPYDTIKFAFIDDMSWLIENDYDFEYLVYMADDTTFIHDVMGIYKNLKVYADCSRELQNCFVPRCRKRVKGGDK